MAVNAVDTTKIARAWRVFQKCFKAAWMEAPDIGFRGSGLFRTRENHGSNGLSLSSVPTLWTPPVGYPLLFTARQAEMEEWAAAVELV